MAVRSEILREALLGGKRLDQEPKPIRIKATIGALNNEPVSPNTVSRGRLRSEPPIAGAGRHTSSEPVRVAYQKEVPLNDASTAVIPVVRKEAQPVFQGETDILSSGHVDTLAV